MTPADPPQHSSALVTDFDGTITEREFYDLAVASYLPPGHPDYWTEYAAGRISHFDALSGIFRHLRCTESQLRALIPQLEPAPGFPDAVAQLQAARWDIVVVSNGCHWYIDPLLESLGVQLPVFSNAGRFVENGGLHMEPPLDSPFFDPAFGIDKGRLVQDLQTRYTTVAFAGNGSPDRKAALAVPPRLRFARGWLANWLRQQNEPFRPFTLWPDIAHNLLA